MRHIEFRRAPAMTAIALSLLAGALGTGCSGALHGGVAGAYVAASANTCWESAHSWESPCSSTCYGNGDPLVLLGAVAVGATVGAIIEVVRWVCEGQSSW
jgi:hypothetical protein